MGINIQPERTKECAEFIVQAFQKTGIHGHFQMPEDLLPEGVIPGSLEHILFITLTVSIDYQRDAVALWNSARVTYEDLELRYLFDIPSIVHTAEGKVIRDMQKHKLTKKPTQDARTWMTVANSLYTKWKGDPRNLLKDCCWDATVVLERLSNDQHRNFGQLKYDYPFLRGNKIGPLWLRMLRDNAMVDQLIKLDQVPIPVDIHVARASLSIGVLQGDYKGKLQELFQDIRDVWYLGTKGLSINNRNMIALDVDEPLWFLSKYGCTHRNKGTGFCPLFDQCEMKEYCVRGTVNITDGFVELDT